MSLIIRDDLEDDEGHREWFVNAPNVSTHMQGRRLLFLPVGARAGGGGGAMRPDRRPTGGGGDAMRE